MNDHTPVFPASYSMEEPTEEPCIPPSPMSPMTSLHLEILSPAQRRLWDELNGVPSQFTLYGGTAIALYLGHRESVDFDFFGSRSFDPQQLYATVPFLKGAGIVQQTPDTLTCLVKRDENVQVSFLGVPGMPVLREPLQCPDNGVRIASLIDLAGTKAAVVQQRAEVKDYLDLYALISRKAIDLSVALAAASRIYPDSFNPQLTLKALTYFGDGELPTLPESVRVELVEAVRAVDPDRLPDVGTCA